MTKKHTPPKPKPKSSKKTGRKTKPERTEQNKILRDCFDNGAISPYRASQLAQCGYEYAVNKFRFWAIHIVEKESGDDWINKNEQVRKRALEGISTKTLKAIKTRKKIEAQITATEEKQQDAFNRIEEFVTCPSCEGAVKVLSFSHTHYQKYGFLLTQLYRELRSQIIFITDLQQQYDSIEILPPPKVILEAEIERRILEKQKLYSKSTAPE